MGEHAVAAWGLSKQYGDLKAVDRIDLRIERGELFSLLGPNGAGKTTTIKMLSTLISPTGGRAELLGNDIITDRDEVRRLTNVSPQENAVAEHLSVRENLELIGGSYGLAKDEIARRCEEYLSLMNIADRAKTKAKNLSGGLKRRLSIAMALITDPDILFLDEPTLGLDPEARRELWGLIEGLKGRKTILLTTHYLEEADTLSDHLAIMNRGKIIASGTPESIKQEFDGVQQMILTGGPFPDAFLDGISYDASIENGQLVISAESIDVNRMISLIHEHTIKLERITMKEPTLDDVYLHLVGKEAGDEV